MCAIDAEWQPDRAPSATLVQLAVRNRSEEGVVLLLVGLTGSLSHSSSEIQPALSSAFAIGPAVCITGCQQGISAGSVSQQNSAEGQRLVCLEWIGALMSAWQMKHAAHAPHYNIIINSQIRL